MAFYGGAMYVRVLAALYEVLWAANIDQSVGSVSAQINDQKIYPRFHPVANSDGIEEFAGL